MFSKQGEIKLGNVLDFHWDQSPEPSKGMFSFIYLFFLLPSFILLSLLLIIPLLCQEVESTEPPSQVQNRQDGTRRDGTDDGAGRTVRSF